MRIITYFFTLTVLLLTFSWSGGAQTWNLAADWSDASNPNGVWSYNGAPDTPITTSQIDWDPSGSTVFGSAQPAWAAAVWPENDHVPVWFKRISDTATIDIPIGSVGMHGNEWDDPNIWVGVVWTSPVTETINVTGGVWFAHTGVSRNADWRIRLNDAVLTTGNVSAGDGSSSSSPNSLLSGSGGASALQSLEVSAGDRITLEFISLTSFACFIGVDLTISTTVPEVPTMSFLGLMVLCLCMLVLGFIVLQRRRLPK
jgi:hypothetical protein